MKYDIIKTDDYLLVVDEGEIKGWYYDAYINKVKHSGGAEYGESIITRNIIAHLPLNGYAILEGVELLPPLEEGDVEKLALDKFPRDENWLLNSDNADKRPIWVDGYNTAKTKYKYTEEDLRKAMFLYNAWITGGTPSLRIAETAEERQKQIIQSLSQPKMPIGFECNEMIMPAFKDKFGNIRTEKKILKTTTTPEGNTQWVGTYIYE